MFAPTSLFPAHAGMNRRSGNAKLMKLPVPRTRGDEPRVEASE